MEKDNCIFEKVMQLLQHSYDFLKVISLGEDVLSAPGIEIDLEKRLVLCDSNEIKLTTKEFDILG